MRDRFRIRTASLLLAVVMATAAQASAQEDFPTRLQEALVALDATEVENAISLLNDLLTRADSSVSATALGSAYFHLGAAHYVLGAADSAAYNFRQAVASDPFFQPDPELFQPNLVATFESARVSTLALGMRVPADTVLDPLEDRLPLEFAVGAPGELTIRLRAIDPGASPLSAAAMQISRSARHSVSLMVRDSQSLDPGTYLLTASLTVDGLGRDSVMAEIRVVRQAVDTLLHRPPLDSALFLPESEKGKPPVTSLLRGLFFGAAVVALPVVVASSDLSDGIDPRAIAVGASISLAGIVGLVVGRPNLPIETNIASNQRLATGWQAENQSIIEANRVRRLLAPLHITTVERR